MLRATGDTLEGPRETDAFDIVPSPGGMLSVVLLDARGASESPQLMRALLARARRGLLRGLALHQVMMELVRVLFDHPASELRVTLLRLSAVAASVEVACAGMPPLVCAFPDGTLNVLSQPNPALSALSDAPPPTELVSLVWGSVWLAASDGFTSGSLSPQAVRKLAIDIDLNGRGGELSRATPEGLYDTLAGVLSASGRFARDDATLVLASADPHARFRSGVQRGSP
jgi:serine phosphatase RsbU (regulator of sigma subunit)